MPHACRNVLSVELPLIYTVHGSPPIGPSQATVGRPGLQNMQHTHTQTHTHTHNHYNMLILWKTTLKNQTRFVALCSKFGCKQTSSLEDIVEIVIYYLYNPSLWPWHWRKWTNFFCMTLWLMMLHNHTKWSAVQKISSGQTFTDILNLCCDLHLQCNNHIFLWSSLAYDVILSNQVWLKTDQWFQRNSRNSLLDYINPCCDLDTEDSEPIFVHDTPSASW